MNDNLNGQDDQSPDADMTNPDNCIEKEFPGSHVGSEHSFQVIAKQSVLNDMHRHAHSRLDAEICGVLVGDVYRDGDEFFLHIEASIRGEHATSELAGVTFTAETWSYMQDIMDEHHPGKKIVGWYHSHPDFGVFLSDMDLFIHQHFFNLPWQVAHVYDPVRREEGVFVWRSGEPTIEPFAVQEDEKPAVLESPDPAREEAAPNTVPSLADEVACLRRKVKWLTAGIILALVVSLAWPVTLVLISRHSHRVREGGRKAGPTTRTGQTARPAPEVRTRRTVKPDSGGIDFLEIIERQAGKSPSGSDTATQKATREGSDTRPSISPQKTKGEIE
jgi:proteasome lid subunit RPN8/RPN11